MRVALDAGPLLRASTGVGRYVRELGLALEGRGLDVVRYAIALRGSGAEISARWRVPARAAQAAWMRLGGPPLERLVGRVDVVHATNFVLPAVRSAAGVVTVHDLSFLRGDAFPGSVRLRALVPWSVHRAARVIVPTEAVRGEVMDRLGVPAERVAVTHEGVAPVFFGATPLAEGALARLGVRPPFAVAAGTIEPRKNLARLLDAWERARRELDGWTLVLAGPRGWGPEPALRAGVVPTGWVGDETLPGLLAAADIFCYPSLYEGFGLPPLEAMAAGTAVLAGDYPAAAEVLKEAALRVDATDVGAIAEGLARLASDDGLRRSLGAAGRARAAQFTWERTARATHRVYEEAVA